MESRHFKKILKLVSSLQIKLDVVETACIKHEAVEWILHTDLRGFVSKRPAPALYGADFRDLLAQFLREHERKRQICTVSADVCTITSRYGRHLCTSPTVRDVVSKKKRLTNVSMVQRLPTEPVRFYLYSLAFLNGQYETTYACRDSDGAWRQIPARPPVRSTKSHLVAS